MRIAGLLAAGVLALTLSTVQAFAAQLVMVEQHGCAYCAAWDKAIAPIYPKTPEGKFAPLLRTDIHDAPPAGITYARSVNFTPTFILVEAGQEIGRIEGYPGEDFFWGLLEMMLKAKTDFDSEAPDS